MNFANGYILEQHTQNMGTGLVKEKDVFQNVKNLGEKMKTECHRVNYEGRGEGFIMLINFGWVMQNQECVDIFAQEFKKNIKEQLK